MSAELTVQCHPRWLWKFNALLQKGVRVRCLANQNLMEMLKEDFHLEDDYISQRIQTITLDGRPVDDPGCVIVLNGATLAISGAMPGLVGATLRKGGFYAAMRGTISYCASDMEIPKPQAGMITVKLFNLILKDLAAAFLSRGIGMAGMELVPLLDDCLTLPVEEFGPVVQSGDILDWSAVRESYLEMALLFVTVKPTLSTGNRREHPQSISGV